jgi:hypothetical protein
VGFCAIPVVKLTVIQPYSYTTPLFQPSGQVAQLVERGPEKAGVGGSIPSLATNTFNNLQIAKNTQYRRANNTRTFISQRSRRSRIVVQESSKVLALWHADILIEQ